MAGDPFKLFAEESDSKRETLKMVWPALYDVLAGPLAAAADKPWGCAYAAHVDPLTGQRVEYRPVVGRIWLNGPPACADCLVTLSSRPGGFPLTRVDPDKWRG